MLAVKQYSLEYISHCRRMFDAIIADYRAASASVDRDQQSRLFGALILALDSCFMHRMRGLEGKNGNPLNEVRMIASAIMNNDGRLVIDQTIRYDPSTSILGLEFDAPIDLNADRFERLAHAFFDEIERRFT